MAWIEVLDDRDWTDDDLANLWARSVDADTGRVDNIISIHSLDPGSMGAHLDLYQQAMRSTRTLRKVEREMIALVVSGLNECTY